MLYNLIKCILGIANVMYSQQKIVFLELWSVGVTLFTVNGDFFCVFGWFKRGEWLWSLIFCISNLVAHNTKFLWNDNVWGCIWCTTSSSISFTHLTHSTSNMSLAMAYIHASTVHQPSECRKFSVFSETSFVFSTKHRCNVIEFPLDPHTSHGEEGSTICCQEYCSMQEAEIFLNLVQTGFPLIHKFSSSAWQHNKPKS